MCTSLKPDRIGKNTTNKGIYRWIIALAVVSLFSTIAFSLNVYADNGNTKVHITETGSCYHREGCGHLRSDIEVTLYEAERDGYQPCDDCNPPIYDGPPIEDASPKKQKSINYGTVDKAESVRTGQISTPAVVSTPPKIEQKESRGGEIILYTVLFLLFIVPTGIIIIGSIVSARETRAKKKREKEEYEIERHKYNEMYANIDPLTLVDVPEGVFLKDGYPCTADEKKGIWGNYTVYVAQKNRRVFHLNPKCGGSTLVPINYFQANRLPHCKRCAVRRIKLPELDWYIEYLRIVRIKKKYNIP